MSISSRLSLFFLLALGVVLAGFSVTLYGLASWHLHSQLERQLDSAMHVLIAAIEVHPEDVQWEPLERKISIGADPDLTHVRWTLHDEEGQLIDCSENLTGRPPAAFDAADLAWQSAVRQISAGRFTAGAAGIHPRTPSPDMIAGLPADRTAVRHGFIVTTAISQMPVNAALHRLAATMGIISLIIWATAAVWGRWLCQRALSPITRMAASARALRQMPESRSLLEFSQAKDELADLGMAFNQLLVTLRDTIDRQQRFAGDASHQLRTPLAAMLAAVDVGSRQARSTEEYQRILSVVQRRGRDLQQIIEVLLALARQPSGPDVAGMECIELNAWCRGRIESWQADPRCRDFDLQLSPADLFVNVQPAILGQVMDNLLDNACKYSDAGSLITIRTQADGADAIIRVEDRGPGIPAGELAEIFEPFFRSARARQQGKPGSGLGLTLAQRLAASFSGRVEVDSTEGKGSVFLVRLPCAARRGVVTSGPLQTSRSADSSHFEPQQSGIDDYSGFAGYE